MKSQILLKSLVLVTYNLSCLVSSQRNQGYRYPVPNRQLQYPKNSPDTFRLDSRERFNNGDDDDLLSNLQGDQEGRRGGKQGRRGQNSRNRTSQRGSVPQRELPDENYDEDDRENSFNQNNIRDRINNEVDQERFVDEGGNGNGGTEDRFVEGNEGGLAEGGSTLTRRRTSFRNDRKKAQDKRRGSSTNIDEIVTNAKSSSFTNRDLFNKAYNIGRADDEVISGSSQRKKLLESSFRKDVQAPSYSNFPDDDDFDTTNFKTASTTIQKSSTSTKSAPGRSYGGSDDDDDDDFGASSTFKNSSSLTVLGGTFAASNNDQVVSRGGNGTSKGSGIKNYYQSDDISGSGSAPALTLSSPSSSSARGGSRTASNAKRQIPIDSRAVASKPSVKIASNPERAQFASRQKKQSGAQERVTGSINTGITKTGFICPGGGCILSAASSSTSDGSGLRFVPAGSSFFPQRPLIHHPFGGFFHL